MPETIAHFYYRHEAEIAKGFLDDAGIESLLLIDDAGGAQVGMALSNQARLVVADDDALRARELLAHAGFVGHGIDGAQ